MRNILGIVLFALVGVSNAAPVVYTDKDLYLAGLDSLGYSVISESFEDNTIWSTSRDKGIPSIVSQGIQWTSNYTENNISTGTVGGSVLDGSYAFYSNPHGMLIDSGPYCDSAGDPLPIQCYQNDGFKIQSESGKKLYAMAGHISSNTGTPKVTFILDGVDIKGNNTDNVENWQREGYAVSSWSFIGVIDQDGFVTAEIRELTGKDSQQQLMFSDDFTIGVSNVPLPTAFWLFATGVFVLLGRKKRSV